ncbi:LOW QUALITY PROTEIN: immunoglobulin superfamily DCC subclass member 4 [Megalops cyprinoides]|uniref:LOW QUALITY PROTEIN: immunoglobulin superfamily DCC subclass member 4 n=1 Tax=Megalops cyprinoides TaxID=118141 RepID=UPI0018645FA8|nr:LOW QUALITY PROTEIN: immunoglobulin superfamily DCC subclass member 4 [Megalops cyprinoides]
MAVENICFICLLSLGFCVLSTQEKPASVELSCGAGPVHVVLEPGHPLLLDCHLGATETPFNVTWLRDGELVQDGEAVRTLPNGSLVLLGREGRLPPGVEGGYSCVSASPFGALTSRTLSVHLASLSRFLQHPESQIVPAGAAARFECHVDGLPMPSITWEKDQVPVPTQTRFISLPNGALQILGVQEEDAGTYRCVASNSARKRFSQDATLTVTTGQRPVPGEVVIVAPPRNTTVISGRPAVMECMAQGQPKPLVSWSRLDGKPIATDVVVLATNLLIPDTRRHHGGVYVCRANKPKTREFVIATAELRVLAPPVILQPPETVSLSRGNTARFVCNSSGEPPPALRWLKNGEPVLSNGRVKTQSPGVLLINQLGPDDAGYYQCIAANSLGTACATAKLSVIVREGLPSAPRRLSAQPYSSTSALLTWERPELNSDQIIGFSVHYQRAAGSDNMEYQFAVNNDTTEYHVKELQPHTAYTFYVVAYSPMGASRPSQPVTVEMLEDVPSAPPQLSLFSTSSTDIRVMWLPLSSQHSRGAITRYRVDYCALEHEDNVTSVEVAGNETQVTLRGLRPNQLYRVRMAAGTRAGFGTPSEWTLHRTPDHINHTMVLFAPTELKVRAKMHSLLVTWQPPPNHTQISGYKLFCREAELEEQANEDGPGSERERAPGAQPIKLRKRTKHHEVTGLIPDRLYEVKVWAYNKQTDGYAAVWKGRTEKAPVTGVPPQGFLPPLPPSGVQASANSSTSIWLRWEKPRFSTVRIINYTVRCSPAGLRNASLVSYYTSSAQEILLGALKPFTRYELAVQSNGLEVDGPFSNTVEESTFSDRPYTPPAEFQLTALDSNCVLVSWRPPLEANGIIVEYRILYSGNSTLPDHQWSSLSCHGSLTSTEVQDLLSGTHYFFKMGACTSVGAGPFSAVKDVHTPPEKYELDIPSVTGIIVGVCLGLLCILLCMCVSFRNGKARELSGGLDPSALPPQYRRGRPVPTPAPECSDCHELETLMSPGAQDPVPPLSEVTEEHSLMGGRAGDDSPALEAKPAWNGSVSRNWANRITRYRDTITEDSPALSNGSLSPASRRPSERPLDAPTTESSMSDAEERLYSSLCSNQVEAEVIVHSELSDPEGDREAEGEGETRDHSPLGGPTSPRQPTAAPAAAPPDPGEGPQEAQPSPLQPPPAPCNPAPEVLTNHSRQQEAGLAQGGADRWMQQPASPPGVGLTNGFHAPEPLENGDSFQPGNRHLLPGKALSMQLPLPPSPFASSGLVHSTSAARSYLCP